MKKYFFYKNKFWFFGTLLFQTLESSIIIGIAIILNMLIDTIGVGNSNHLLRMGVIGVAYAFATGVVIWLAAFFYANFQKNAIHNLKQDLILGVLQKGIPEFQTENSAYYISMLNNDITVLQENYFSNFFTIAQNIFSILLASAILCSINWVVALFAIVVSGIPMIIPQMFGKKLASAQEDISKSSAKYNEKLKDIFTGFEVVKSYSIENKILLTHKTVSEVVETSKCKQGIAMGSLYGITNFLAVTVQFSIILFAGILSFKGLLTIGNIIAVTQLAGQAITPAFELSAKFGKLKTVKALLNKMVGIIPTKRFFESKEQEALTLKSGINVKELSFSYENRKVLDQVSTVFEKGKKYAIVGESGSGKSTLLKLLLNYYDNYEGKIYIDNTDYHHINSERLNRLFAFLHQNIFLFDDTLKNNITLYDECDESILQPIIEKVGLTTLTERLPLGINTDVGENGSCLSGGEKQRIAIARAFLKGASVLMLDEATAALDNETAYHIENAILSMEDLTGIVVTHRYNREILKKYDEILVMRNGKVIETGDFDTLINLKGYFYSLYSIAS